MDQLQQDQPNNENGHDIIIFEDNDEYCEELDAINASRNDEQWKMPNTPPESPHGCILELYPELKLEPEYRKELTELTRRPTCTMSDLELIDYVFDNHLQDHENPLRLAMELMWAKEQLIILDQM